MRFKPSQFLLALILFVVGQLPFVGSVSAEYVSLDGVLQVGPISVYPGARYVRLADATSETTTVLAGRPVVFESASALIGSSSDAVFVAVVSGAARLGSLTAGPGEALLLQPYGRAPTVVRFDAERMAAMFADHQPATLQGFVADLRAIADDQSWGIFFGRYQRSLLDLQAPGGARAEAGRASVMGAPEVARIRYSGQSDLDQIEEMVVLRAVAALRARDAASLSQLLDPAPYGGDDLQGGGADARLLVARELVAQHAGASSGDIRRGAGEGVWRAGSVTLRTRPFSDFVFISAIE